MKKLLAKLVNYVGTRENNSQTIHNSAKETEDNSRLAEERHKIIMEGRGSKKYISEGITIPEGQVRRPDDSAAEKEKV